jgi:hypothetical protein
MSKSTTADVRRERYDRTNAARYLREHHRLPVTAKALANRHSLGTGPKVVYYGSKPLYPEDELDRWAEAQVHAMPRRAAFGRGASARCSQKTSFHKKPQAARACARRRRRSISVPGEASTRFSTGHRDRLAGRLQRSRNHVIRPSDPLSG